MAKIYYCENCRTKLKWNEGFGKTKEIRCNMCNEHSKCFIGDTTLLSSLEEKEPLQVREPLDASNEVKEDEVAIRTKKNFIKKNEPKENIDGLKINADFLHSTAEKSTESIVNSLLSNVLSNAHKCAKKGLYTLVYNTFDISSSIVPFSPDEEEDNKMLKEVVKKLVVELKNRGLSVNQTEFRIEIGW